MLEPSASLYRLLATEPTEPGAIRTRKTFVSESRFVLHGLDAAQMPLLIVPLSLDEPEVRDSSCRGVDLQTFPHVLDAGGGGVPCVFFRCVEGGLAAQFAYMVDDLMANLGRDPGEKVGWICLQVLDKWRDLLGDRLETLLPVESQIGLIGELHVLERLLSQDQSLAMRAWSGPSMARHDFQGSSAAVEVKATISRDNFNVNIHGWYQLAQPKVGPLFLYVERLERVVEGQGESLSEVVTRLLDSMAGRAELLGRLKEAGYDHGDSSAYNAFRYAVLARRCYEVGADFPRLTREALLHPEVADVIGSLRYVVDVGVYPPVSSDDEALDYVAGKLSQ